MAEENNKFPKNALTAEELLRIKGIKYYALDEYEKSVETLPKTGKKEFEPNGSWLRNMQLEKGLTTRKNLIGIERVDRTSQLASAEWLPAQKRARVTKCSGQDWGNFGLEKNSQLYLIPEEALFLLEANCLELIWNDIPLSIEQAYELLIDNIECSIDEYRVYSHLVRYGYRIQRFVYDSEKNGKNYENNMKRKVIVDPENGLWKTDDQQQIKIPENTHSKELNQSDENSRVNIDLDDSDIEICQKTINESIVSDDIQKVMTDLLCAVERIEPETDGTSLHIVELNKDTRKKNSKVKIISEETLLKNIKIVTDSANHSSQSNNTASGWRASRIQRNVKLLPKRTDKPLLNNDITILDSSSQNSEHNSRKHKSSESFTKESPTKKSKQEVIELSDDEIQEVAKPMTRIYMLNLLPNIAFKTTITINISREYIPRSIKPQRTVYSYECKKLRNLKEVDVQLRSKENLEYLNGNINERSLQCISPNRRNRKNTSAPPYNQNGADIQNVLMQKYFTAEHQQYSNYERIYMHNNRLPHAYGHNSYLLHRYPLLPRNQFHHNFHQYSLFLRRIHHHQVVENMSMLPPFHCSINRDVSHLEPRQRYWPRNNHKYASTSVNSDDEVYQSSFKLLSGVSSWSELKAKWREKKTITIDDEDIQTDESDCNEVQIVELRSPLVEPKNANSLEEVFSRLKIIKSATEKTVRKKKNRYKISYNVYSNTQAYRKASPGPPLYKIVVVRQDDSFIEPIELHRLQQDASNLPIVLACVSMSISFIQPGFVFIPNLT